MALQDCKNHLENELEGRDPSDASSIRLRAAIGLVASIIEDDQLDRSAAESSPQLDLPFVDEDVDEDGDDEIEE